MSYDREFETIDILLASKSAETRGVDAFALCIIKMERQSAGCSLSASFSFRANDASIPELKAALTDEHIYYEGFIKGFEALHPKSIADLVGSDHSGLQRLLAVIKELRNKIFHGQITGRELSRETLIDYVRGLQRWCRLLGEGAHRYFGYEGFDNSFQKSSDVTLAFRYKFSLTGVTDYKNLLKTLRR